MSDVLGIKPGRGGEVDDEASPEVVELREMFADVPEEPVEIVPAPSDDEPEQPGQAPPAEEEAPEGETAEEEAARLYANRFPTVQGLEDGYTEVRNAFTKVTMENSSLRAEYEAQQQALADQQQQIGAILEMMQTQLSETDPDFADELRKRMEIQRAVAQRVEPLQQQLTQQQQLAQQQIVVEQERAQARGAVERFMAAHPEVVPGSETDNLIVARYIELANAGVELDVTNPEHYEIAYEASQNPTFMAELMMAPNAVKIPGGVARVRERSGATIAAAAVGRDNSAPAARGPVRKRLETFVETGSGGAPLEGAPGEKPTDEFDEAWSYYKSSFEKGPLFGSKR